MQLHVSHNPSDRLFLWMAINAVERVRSEIAQRNIVPRYPPTPVRCSRNQSKAQSSKFALAGTGFHRSGFHDSESHLTLRASTLPTVRLLELRPDAENPSLTCQITLFTRVLRSLSRPSHSLRSNPGTLLCSPELPVCGMQYYNSPQLFNAEVKGVQTGSWSECLQSEVHKYRWPEYTHGFPSSACLYSLCVLYHHPNRVHVDCCSNLAQVVSISLAVDQFLTQMVLSDEVPSKHNSTGPRKGPLKGDDEGSIK